MAKSAAKTETREVLLKKVLLRRFDAKGRLVFAQVEGDEYPSVSIDYSVPRGTRNRSGDGDISDWEKGVHYQLYGDHDHEVEERTKCSLEAYIEHELRRLAVNMLWGVQPRDLEQLRAAFQFIVKYRLYGDFTDLWVSEVASCVRRYLASVPDAAFPEACQAVCAMGALWKDDRVVLQQLKKRPSALKRKLEPALARGIATYFETFMDEGPTERRVVSSLAWWTNELNQARLPILQTAFDLAMKAVSGRHLAFAEVAFQRAMAEARFDDAIAILEPYARAKDARMAVLNNLIGACISRGDVARSKKYQARLKGAPSTHATDDEYYRLVNQLREAFAEGRITRYRKEALRCHALELAIIAGKRGAPSGGAWAAVTVLPLVGEVDEGIQLVAKLMGDSAGLKARLKAHAESAENLFNAILCLFLERQQPALLTRMKPFRDKMLALCPKPGMRLAYGFACAAARLGETDDAFDWLARAHQLGLTKTQIRADSDFAPLKKDSRFKRYR